MKSDKNSFNMKRMIKTFKKSLQVKGHGFTDMSKQKPISSRLVWKMSPRPKNAQQVWSNVKFMFDFLWSLITMNFYLVARLSTKSTILKRLNVCKRQWEEKGPIHGGRKNGCSTKTMPPQILHSLLAILVITRPHSSHNFWTRQISHQQTSFCSQSMNSHWKVDVPSLLRTSK